MISKKHVMIKNLLEQMKHCTKYPNITNISLSHIEEMYELEYITKSEYTILFNILNKINRCSDTISALISNPETIITLNRLDITRYYDNATKCYDVLNNMIKSEGIFKTRTITEFNPSYIQPIMYMPIKQGNEYFLLKNLNVTDNRIKGKYDFCAGHMNYHDIFREARRELFEEVGLEDDEILQLNYKGLLSLSNNLSSISYYHFGILIECIIRDEVLLKNKEPHKHEIVKLSDINEKEVFTDCDNWFIETLTHLQI